MGDTDPEQRRIRHVADLETGQQVLFNDRKLPLEVREAGEDQAKVEGPQGGDYIIYHAPDNPDLLLVAKPGHREYASKVNNLRTVAEWERVDDTTWHHTGSGATIHLERTDAGYWTLDVEDFEDADPDLPLYGFTERDRAAEEAKQLMRKFPEG